MASAVGVPTVKPSAERDTNWVAPVATRPPPAVLQGGADPSCVADVAAADLVRDARERDIALDERAVQQLGIVERDLMVDHPVHRQCPVIGGHRRDEERVSTR